MEASNIYIGGLPEDIDDESFKQLFEGFGTVLSMQCVVEKKYGFVGYSSKEDAQAVIDAMNGFEFNGTALQVRFAVASDGAASLPAKATVGGLRPQQPRSAPQAGGTAAWPAGGASGGTGKSWAAGASWPAGGGGDAWGKGGGGGQAWGKGGGGDKGWGAGAWSPSVPVVEADPSDNLYIKGLPKDFDDKMVREIFAPYGTITSLKVMSYSTDSCALMRMGHVDMATWMVENLNGNIPEGLTQAISVRFADNPTSKAKKVQGMMGKDEGKGGEAAWGPSFAKGNGKFGDSPYGAGGKGGGAVQFGSLEPNLPEEVQIAVDTVIFNLGGGGKKTIAPAGDESNLYIKDLPGAADDLYLYKLMSPFGALESIVVKKGDGWAIAFVKFMTNEDAANAIIGLTNCLLPDGTMPKISVKVSKA